MRISRKPTRAISWLDSWVNLLTRGRGQAGTVFLGEDDDGHPLFAIKAIHLPLAVGVGLPRRRTFLGYNRVLRKLNHPNVNPYLGWTVVQDEAQVFTAYCKQGSLAHMIPEGGIKDSNLIKKWTRQILEGLCYLHSHGIVHRDIKPGNILIHNGECRVADLGSARIQQMCCLVPHQLKLSGTPAFTCPEAVVSKIIQEKQGEDIWGLGCILYQMVTGLEPFHDRDNIFTIYYELGQRFSDPTLPHPLDVPGLSPDLKDLVDQCLEFDPIKRPSAFSLRKHRYFN
ncbi:kinase-like domain-containing protein [Gorgonomyces haynaldii]|nr:kinase-like domain-containing protein [Gorgonomyces haynaldii]